VKLRVLVIVLLLAVGGAAVFVTLGGLPTAAGADTSKYLTAAATTGNVTQSVAATGTVAATETWALAFGGPPQLVADGATPTAGSGTWRVASVKAAVGQAVKKGALLATASTSDLDAQLTSARTSLRSARIQERQAKATLDAASGTAAIRQAKIQYYAAVNARREATTTVSNLRTQIREARIVAPIDGTITAVDIAPGSDSTGTAFTIASSTYDVTADVAESDISSVSMGQDATVTVAAIDAAIQGKVSAIAPAASSSDSSGVVSFPVTVTLTGGPSTLRPGMTTDITIVSASADNVLTIPSEALRGSTGSYRVQVLGADGVPVSRDVAVGLVTATTSEIKSGLTEGEIVVTGTAAQRAATSGNGNGNGRNSFGGGLALPGGGVTFSKP